MKTYSESIKEQMVRRLLTPPGVSVLKLAEETGISTSALCKWRKARVKATGSGAKDWTASEKLRVLGGGTPPLEGEAFGALLRREGLHEAQVIAWRAAAAEALGPEAAPVGANSAQQELAEAKKRVKELERDALRKDKALAEAAALLLLEKKLQSIGWHSAVASTGTRSDE